MSRRSTRWAAPLLAFTSAVVVAVLAVVTNIATGLIPPTWTWAAEPWFMWPLVGVLILLGAVLAALASGRGPDERGEPGPGAAGAGDATVTVGTLHGGAGTTILAGAGSRITMSAPVVRSRGEGPIVHGDIPAQPAAWQARREIEDLRRAVVSGTDVTVVFAAGQRGVGKSQSAAAVARFAATELRWTLVAWINGESEQALLTGFESIGRALGVADPGEGTDECAERTRNHLRTLGGPGLLVIDNAESADRVRRWLPGIGPVRVIITSTERSMAALGTTVEIGSYTRERSVAYLEARTGLADPVGAGRVANELGDLPLALTQAASAIMLRDRTYARYLTRFSTTYADASLTRRDDDPYPRGAAAAILLSLEASEADQGDGAMTRRLLELIAVLDPAGTDHQLRSRLLGASDPAVGTAPSSDWVESLVERLVAVSVLSWVEVGESRVTLHRLIARVVRDRAAAEGVLHDVLRRAIDTVWVRLQPYALSNSDGGRASLDEVTGHVEVLWSHVDGEAGRGVGDRALARSGVKLVARAVRFLDANARYLVAAAISSPVLPRSRSLLGEDDPDTLNLAYQLGDALYHSGRSAEAVSLLEDTLRRARRVLGDHHATTLITTNHLAHAYCNTGRQAEAVPLLERALPQARETDGDDHGITQVLTGSLAYAYERVGRRAEANRLIEETFARSRRTLGDDHVNSLALARIVAGHYRRARRLPEAVTLLEGALARSRRALGEDHHSSLSTALDLGAALGYVGRVDDALALLRDTLARSRRALGADDPLTVELERVLEGPG